MVDLENIPANAKDALSRIAEAQLVIAIPHCEGGPALQHAVEQARGAIPRIGGNLETVILHSDTVAAPPELSDSGLHVLPYPFPATPRNEFELLRPILQVSQALAAQMCCVWSSNPEDTSSTGMECLIHPVASGKFDLAVARYDRLRYDSLINSGIVYPMTRALYGARIRYPMAADLTMSTRLVQHLLSAEQRPGRSKGLGWIAIDAVCGDFKLCQANVGVRLAPPPDSTDVSSHLARLLELLFVDVERNAPFWQRSHISHVMPSFGVGSTMEEPPGAVDVGKMIEGLQLGFENLMDIWNRVLPPATLLELKKLTRHSAQDFRFRDDIWARCVYDFALGRRLRVMTPDHLLRAMTPLYLAWVASYALEVKDLNPIAIEGRLERLCVAFETQKPYFLSRWRWPDRFNP